MKSIEMNFDDSYKIKGIVYTTSTLLLDVLINVSVIRTLEKGESIFVLWLFIFIASLFILPFLCGYYFYNKYNNSTYLIDNEIHMNKKCEYVIRENKIYVKENLFFIPVIYRTNYQISTSKFRYEDYILVKEGYTQQDVFDAFSDIKIAWQNERKEKEEKESTFTV